MCNLRILLHCLKKVLSLIYKARAIKEKMEYLITDTDQSNVTQLKMTKYEVMCYIQYKPYKITPLDMCQTSIIAP